MDKPTAEMWCRVARRIGLCDVRVRLRYVRDTGEEDWAVYHSHGRFDPPANPADERMLRQYWYSLGHFHGTRTFMGDKYVLTFLDPATRRPMHVYAEGADYEASVTALGLAIDALPEDA